MEKTCWKVESATSGVIPITNFFKFRQALSKRTRRGSGQGQEMENCIIRNYLKLQNHCQLCKSLITQCQLELVLTVLTLVLAVLAMVLSEAALVNAELTVVLIDSRNQ